MRDVKRGLGLRYIAYYPALGHYDQNIGILMLLFAHGSEGDDMISFQATDFTGRRRAILDAIGKNAIALVPGGPKESTHGLFRQTNDFYYLCGVETPHSYLLMDGRNGMSTLYLPHQSVESGDREGVLASAENPEVAIEISGVDSVHGIEFLAGALGKVEAIYTPFKQAEGEAESWDTLQRARQERLSDPWDGQIDRYTHFLELVRKRCPHSDIRDLGPIVDDMRLIKDEIEVGLLRRSGQLSALGVIEAMRSTAPGVNECHIDALMRYIYLVHGARDVAYRAIIASGLNAWYGHYSKNNAELKDGDLILVDCAPDYHYYASDIGRMWPINGSYTDVQRQLYGFIVEYHKTFLRLIRPGVTPEQIRDEASAKMKKVVEKTAFAKPIYEEAARRALVFPHHMSHPVGMCVHDVSHYRGKILEPGVVLTLDPQLIIPEERLYIRVEDTMVITEDGFENFTAVAPLELDDVEAVMKERGMLQDYPPFAF